MSMDVFPALPGLQWNNSKSPTFANIIQRSVSGREVRASEMVYPLYTFTLSWSLLRDDQSTSSPASPYDELKTLVGFFLKQNASLTAFLYTDPTDNAVTAMQFATGDASTVAFQLARSYGAGGFTFAEPINNVNGSPLIYKNDWCGNQLQYSTARTNLMPRSQTFASWSSANLAPANNATTAPDSTATASSLTETTANNIHIATQVTGAAVTANQPYTASVFLKAGGGSGLVQISFDDGASNGSYINVNLGTGAITKTSANLTGTYVSSSITALGSGWYLVALTGTIPSTTIGRMAVSSINSTSANLFPSYLGSASNFFYAWGAQLESGSTRTNYIATGAAAVSRTDYTLSASGLVTFANTPATAAILTWTGNFYYRVRFSADSADFNEFMYQLWDLKKLSFVGSPQSKV